jgi:hypothetical protein
MLLGNDQVQDVKSFDYIQRLKRFVEEIAFVSMYHAIQADVN